MYAHCTFDKYMYIVPAIMHDRTMDVCIYAMHNLPKVPSIHTHERIDSFNKYMRIVPLMKICIVYMQ